MRTGGYYYGMKQQPYWRQRAKEQLSETFAGADEVEKYLTDRYKQCLIDFCNQYNELLKPFVKNGKLDSAKLNHAKTYDMKFMAKYKRLEDEIDLISAQLNSEQQAQILQLLKDNYTTNVIDNFEAFGRETHGIAILNTKAVETAVKMPYTTDGREFSDRIWSNLDGMGGKLRKTLSESIAKGESIQKTVRKFKDIFGNTTYNTSRIIRTETMAVYAKASADSYKELGVEKLKSLTEANACDVCKKATDKEIDTDKAEVGLNIPPFHPFCKCCVIPIVNWDDEEENKEKEYQLISTDIYKNSNGYIPLKPNEREWKIIERAKSKFTDKEKKIIEQGVKDVKIIVSDGQSFYNPQNKTIYLSEGFRERDMVHELAHSIQCEMDLFNDNEYKKLVNNCFGTDNLIDKMYTEIYKNNKEVHFIGSDKLVSEYQGRFYDDWDGAYPALLNGNICEYVPEYFTEGYVAYLYNPELLMEKDMDLYLYIIERIRK